MVRQLQERILSEGRVLSGGILKVDGFLNHQLDPGLTIAMGQEFRKAFSAAGVGPISRVVTAEASGIAPALSTAVAYGVPMVYARKKRPLTMSSGVLEAVAPSPTKGGSTTLMISTEYVSPGERVLLIDDFLASGRTVLALAGLLEQAGAELVGAGFVIEKSFQGGRELLAPLAVPIVSLAIVKSLSEGMIELAE
jgi:xanthine phosphoribosyltransferase